MPQSEQFEALILGSGFGGKLLAWHPAPVLQLFTSGGLAMMKVAAMVVVANVLFGGFSSLINNRPTKCTTPNWRRFSNRPTPRLAYQ
jgi:hypothetical protein